MTSYKTNKNKEISIIIIDGKSSKFLGSELGLCVITLLEKNWGKIPINSGPKSKVWWENKLKNLISLKKEIEMKPTSPFENYTEPKPPIPYEVEYNFPDNKIDCKEYFQALDKL